MKKLASEVHAANEQAFTEAVPWGGRRPVGVLGKRSTRRLIAQGRPAFHAGRDSKWQSRRRAALPVAAGMTPMGYRPQVGLNVGSRLKALAKRSLAFSLFAFIRREGSPIL